ncbi:MAG TPA: formate dehydrogenase accessory sulfurtransferase FdhD [Candidatus Dormibacteraeota bacterium]|nr:formate dehydrogenase accessory sulfurtransferase FdhD [Candidatus Dormibacteraeota bacterium]
MSQRPSSKQRIPVSVIADGQSAPPRSDSVATEEPMETRILLGGKRHTVAVTMRTPGADFDLAVGFLYGEGVIGSRDQVRRISYCVDEDVDADQRYNIINVELAGDAEPDLHVLERHFYTSSACGVCGKASLEAIQVRGCPAPSAGPVVDPEMLYGLPDKLRQKQGLFEATGGLHAAALFSASGELVAVSEDVGRHNAVDKLVGRALMEGRLPLADHIVLVSGRSSFEILQKCVAAGVPMVCSVSAPSSLAVDVAREFGVTLVGFLRGRRLNVYAGEERVVGAPVSSPAS